MRVLSRAALVFVAVTAAATAGTVAAATTGGHQAPADDQPPLVEDFTYPGAAQILATDHVQLISGDGHMLYTPCPAGPDPNDLIMVRTIDLIGPTHDGRICFHVLGPSGRLTMKIPAIYSIRGDGPNPGQGHKLKADLTTDTGTHTVVDINPSGTTQVGITTNPPGDPTTLLQLTALS